MVELVPEAKLRQWIRRKKQARPGQKRDDYDHEEDGPRKQQKNQSSQNQVRNQRNSNWNNNKKEQKAITRTTVIRLQNLLQSVNSMNCQQNLIYRWYDRCGNRKTYQT